MKGWCDMKKSIEKIIEKLEEYRDENLVEHDSEMANHCKQDCNDINDCTLCVWDKAIEIVKQTAEEHNNGWILVSERLPEEGGYYLVTYHEWSNGDYLPKFDDTYVRKLHYQKSERFTGWNHPRYCDDKAENYTNREVIAWKPLPQPYQPKGE